ncbi:Cell wall-associated NlpC family hydrolase OS=Ureibacillus acetophenoni OX=614649 GN=SAMN05877842_113113 PE=3 SV=1 [Ureibacillus acetophenoni]
MSVSLRLPKMAMVLVSVLALVAILLFSQAPKASASINYGEEVSEVAKRYVGNPFKWGGTTPKGFHASGFAQYIYKNAGQK